MIKAMVLTAGYLMARWQLEGNFEFAHMYTGPPELSVHRRRMAEGGKILDFLLKLLEKGPYNQIRTKAIFAPT